MQQSLLQLGLDITLFGMGIVFIFLLVLAICTGIMSRLVVRYFPEAEPVAVATAQPAVTADARTRAIIQAAIAQHRKNRKNR